MSKTLVSVKTRQAFREYMVGWVLRQTSDEFDAARIECDLEFSPNVTGQRRCLIEQYYHTVDWSDREQVLSVFQVFEGVLLQLEQSASEPDSTWQQARKKDFETLLWHLKRDGFEWVDGRIVSSTGLPSLKEVKSKAVAFDAHHMSEQIRRMESAVESDPALAIGTAKELVETCCKTILAERGKPVDGTPDIAQLTKATLKELKLVPEGVPDAARGSDVIKRILQNLGSMGNNLAERRGLYGTGHGKHGQTSGLKPHHAKLAVGTAATLAIFLFETTLGDKLNASAEQTAGMTGR